MKTITLTDDQFDTLFELLIKSNLIQLIIKIQDMKLEDWEDLFDVHSVLEEANN